VTLQDELQFILGDNLQDGLPVLSMKTSSGKFAATVELRAWPPDTFSGKICLVDHCRIHRSFNE